MAFRPCSVPDCDGNADTSARGHLGYCASHHRRFKRHGDPLGGKVSHGTLLAWIREHVGFSGDDCLPWPFARGKDGYGRVRYRGKMMTSHRAMCFEAHGEPPDPSFASAHSCGNGKQIACMHPGHLRWATKVENEADKVLHGTDNGTIRASAVLSPEQVEQIRSLRGKASNREIAKQFGVSRSTVGDIQTGRTWARSAASR